MYFMCIFTEVCDDIRNMRIQNNSQVYNTCRHYAAEYGITVITYYNYNTVHMHLLIDVLIEVSICMLTP